MDESQQFKEDLMVKFTQKLNPMDIIKLQRFFDYPTTILTQKKYINTSKIIIFDHKFSLLISNLHFTPIFFFFVIVYMILSYFKLVNLVIIY